MDILDELNKTIKEKNEDWNYVPKREKSETDALIDQLLLEFASESKPGEPIKKVKSYSSQYDVQPESYERREYSQPSGNFSRPTAEIVSAPEIEYIPKQEYTPKPDRADSAPEPQQGYTPLHEVPKQEQDEPFDDRTRVFSREEIMREQEKIESGIGDEAFDPGLIGGYDGELPGEDKALSADDEAPSEGDIEYSFDDVIYHEDEKSSDDSSLAPDRAGQGSGNGDNTPVSGGFGDDYYDENDFEKELESIPSDKIDEKDRGEFEEFIGGQDEDRIRVIKPKEKKKTGKKILRILATAVVAAFTIIGIFSSVIYCLEKLEMMPTEEEEKNESLSDELADAIQPFVMTSIDDFDSAEKISNEQLINLAVWEIVIHGDVKFFKDEETSKILIPQKQIEMALDNILEDTKEIEHKDIAFGGLEIKYESEKESYILPEDYYVLTNYPEVTGVAEENGIYAVNVSCYRDTPHWLSGKKASPIKKMTFTLKKSGDHYKILSAITV